MFVGILQQWLTHVRFHLDCFIIEYVYFEKFFSKQQLSITVMALIWSSGIGITAGAHRLWSHRSYNASMPLRILLVFLFTIAGQVCILVYLTIFMSYLISTIYSVQSTAWCLHLGVRPQDTSQVLGNWCRSAQCTSWLLLLTCRLALLDATSQSGWKTQSNRHVRFAEW